MPVPSILFETLERIAAAAPAPFGTPGRQLDGILPAEPLLFVGDGEIAGTVSVVTTPVPRTVRLVHRESGKLARSTVSDSGGVYRFPRLKRGVLFTVYATDNQPGGYNAAIADYVEAS